MWETSIGHRQTRLYGSWELYLPLQSVPITTEVVSLTTTNGVVYSV